MTGKGHHFRRDGVTPKAGYKTARKAREAARRMLGGGVVFDAYHCSCRKWHIGRRYAEPPFRSADLWVELGHRVAGNLKDENSGTAGERAGRLRRRARAAAPRVLQSAS